MSNQSLNKTLEAFVNLHGLFIFQKNREKVDPDKAQQEIKELAKQKFIDNVLKDSNQLRKQSELISSTIRKVYTTTNAQGYDER